MLRALWRTLVLPLAVAIAVPAGWSVAAAPAQALVTAASGCSSTPFTSTSKARYRLPAAVRSDSGQVFVFAEKRINNFDNDDDGNFNIVMRVSTDNGCTWEPEVTVGDYGTEKVSNPVPIYDRARDRVLLFTTVKDDGRNYLHLQRISGDGSSFSALSAGRLDVPGWRPGLTGPGHGLVLTKGAWAGRIIFAMGYTRKEENDKRAARAIYSDDGGNSWAIGFDRVSPGSLQLIEGSMAELPDGRLLVTYRDNGRGLTTPGKNRVSAVSTDGGRTIGAFTAMPGVQAVPVQGTLLQTSGGRNLLLFSSPSNTSGKITSRRGMRIFVSSDSGASWRRGLAVGSADDQACYSDLVQLGASSIGLFYENGYTREKPYWHRIVFRTISFSAVENSLLPAISKERSPSTVGRMKVGRTLTAKRGLWSPTPTEVVYQWLRDGQPIPGATSSSYKLTRADKRKRISVQVGVSATGRADQFAWSKSRRLK